MKKPNKILSFLMLLALVLGLLCGCSAQDVLDVAETAVDIIEILEESDEEAPPEAPSKTETSVAMDIFAGSLTACFRKSKMA